MSREIILHAKIGVHHPKLCARSMLIVSSKYLIFLAFFGSRTISRIVAIAYGSDKVGFLGVDFDYQVAYLILSMLH